MTPAIEAPPVAFTEANIDHRHLPDTDGSIVTNATEHSQSQLLTTSLWPLLEEWSPDGEFAVGEDVGIYWRWTDPPLDGCKAPDWWFVPGVPGMLEGEFRRSYVIWQERIRPLMVIEYVSGDGRDERDTTPNTGKFWVYEQAIRAKYYVIYDCQIPLIEAYQLDGTRYARIGANAAGRYPIADLGIEFGLHQAVFRKVDLDWLRAWDSATGMMLPDADERTVVSTKQRDAESKRADEATKQRDSEKKRANEAIRQRDSEKKRADEATKQAAAMAQRLRDMGIDPDAGSQ